MDKNTGRINKNLIIGWGVIAFVMLVAYYIEVKKGELTTEYYIPLVFAIVLPLLFSFIMYFHKPESVHLRYIILLGYFIMYIYVMMTGTTELVFTYILPLLAFLVLYHQPSLILFSGAVAVLVNVYSLVNLANRGELTIAGSRDAEVQMAVLIFCLAGAYLASNLYSKMSEENEAYLKLVNEKNAQIQKMTFQTITTIVNTIDAKDEYTKGHSRRVSLYSAAIARKLGLDDETVEKISSIALLHDIGKIGVPDSVLNKPGTLSHEEYQFMKRHTVVGGEILKDIGMIPDIDIGAKYHHERYDGKGYPEGLKGEEIPFIARIIAVADAYDAMTSNRVYRQHLNKYVVLQELESGKGTQFDPDAAKAMIDLVNEGKAEEIVEQFEDDSQTISDTSTILARVLEKQEAQFAEKFMMDELTGVYNRNYGEKLVRDVVKTGKGALVIYDIDEFRKINSESGYVIGDILIKFIADAVKRTDSNGDIIVSRFEADEFVVLYKNVTTQEQMSRILDGFYKDIRIKSADREELSGLSVSEGVVFYEKHHEPIAQLLIKAGRALYHAKQQGGNRYETYKESELMIEDNMSKVDLQFLISKIKEESAYEGGFDIIYPEFSKIFEFIRNVAQRNKQKVQIIMFTVHPENDVKVSMEVWDRSIECLDKAISKCIRSVDISTKYSSAQKVVLLMNLSEENTNIVISRILKEYSDTCKDKEVVVSYDVADLSKS